MTTELTERTEPTEMTEMTEMSEMAGRTNSWTSEDLREYFAGRLPQRLAELEEACRDARDAGFTGDPLRTFHRLAHSLAGAGATFGFPQVTEISRELERILKTFLERAAPADEAEIRGIGEFLDQLRSLPTT